MLRTYTGTLATVGAASGNVECTDNVEHLLFKCSRICFLCGIVTVIIEDTFDTAAGRTYVTACITADTAGQFVLPECETLFRSHCLELLNQFKTAFFCRFLFVAVLCQLVVDNVFSALAGFASFQDNILSCELFVAVNSCHFDGIAVFCYSGNTLASCFTDLFDIEFSIAADADDIGFLAIHTMLFD